MSYFIDDEPPTFDPANCPLNCVSDLEQLLQGIDLSKIMEIGLEAFGALIGVYILWKGVKMILRAFYAPVTDEQAKKRFPDLYD